MEAVGSELRGFSANTTLSLASMGFAEAGAGRALAFSGTRKTWVSSSALGVQLGRLQISQGENPGLLRDVSSQAVCVFITGNPLPPRDSLLTLQITPEIRRLVLAGTHLSQSCRDLSGQACFPLAIDLRLFFFNYMCHAYVEVRR